MKVLVVGLLKSPTFVAAHKFVSNENFQAPPMSAEGVIAVGIG
jgi:hypothetical protein